MKITVPSSSKNDKQLGRFPPFLFLLFYFCFLFYFVLFCFILFFKFLNRCRSIGLSLRVLVKILEWRIIIIIILNLHSFNVHYTIKSVCAKYTQLQIISFWWIEKKKKEIDSFWVRFYSFTIKDYHDYYTNKNTLMFNM